MPIKALFRKYMSCCALFLRAGTVVGRTHFALGTGVAFEISKNSKGLSDATPHGICKGHLQRGAVV